jgi:hypothetical protein
MNKKETNCSTQSIFDLITKKFRSSTGELNVAVFLFHQHTKNRTYVTQNGTSRILDRIPAFIHARTAFFP